MSRLLAAALVVGLATAASADDSKLKVKEGDAFPDVPLAAAQIEKAAPSKDAKTVSIADLKGKIVVIFFYPKALTGGCTVESCGFRDLSEKFPKDVVVIGASADDQKLQNQFIEKNMLPFALLCDTDMKLIQSLGIQSPKGKVPQRVTFVVGKDGKIAKIYDKVTPKSHPEEVLAFVTELSKK
jgi:peroxiredoxin Q/BCP